MDVIKAACAAGRLELKYPDSAGSMPREEEEWGEEEELWEEFEEEWEEEEEW